MKSVSLATALAVLPAGVAFAQSPPVPTAKSDIVITAKSLVVTQAALNTCVRNHCPTDQDIAATLQHAENEFVAGKYAAARDTLRASIRRNKRAAKRFPVLVASLYRANGRVAAHLGEVESYRINTIESVDALKAGLPDADPRILAQRVEIADMMADIGRPDGALAMYRQVIEQARKNHLPQIEGPARLRVANVRMREAMAAGRVGNETRAAVAELDGIIGDPNSAMSPYRMVARVMKARLYVRMGDDGPLNELISELGARLDVGTPVLVDSKPIQLGNMDKLQNGFDGDMLTGQAMLGMTGAGYIPAPGFDGQWIDISYFIKPDGSVSDAEIIRESRPHVGPWTQAVISSVESRRFTPFHLKSDDPGILRVERYTYTAEMLDAVTGSRMRTRSVVPRIEMLDLTMQANTDKS